MSGNFVNQIKERCKKNPQPISFVEGDDARILTVSANLLNEGTVSQVLFPQSKSQIEKTASAANLDLSALWDKIECRSSADPLVDAAQWLYDGQVAAVLAGVKYTTAQVIRAGISGVGLAPKVRTVSGSFIMNRPDPATLCLFADSGVVIEPTVKQVIDIAQESVLTLRKLVPHMEPKVGFISFSTKGSANHAAAEKMSIATEGFRERMPEVKCDGELQFDAAIDAKIGQAKAPGSPVAGEVNTFIFANLDAGNIAYKLAQRWGGFEAYGPILQGLAKPFSDLSRGATVADITASAYINLIRGQSDANP